MESMGEVISEVGGLLSKLVDAPHGFVYLQVGPGGSLLFAGPEPAPEQSQLLGGKTDRFVKMRPAPRR